MKKIALIILSVLLVLISIWGGAYFLSIYGYGSWQNFPIFITAFYAGAGGYYIFIHAVTNLK